MLTFPNIDPIAIDLGFLQVRWYGLSYIAGILWEPGRCCITGRSRDVSAGPWNRSRTSCFTASWGVIIGGRLGSVLFYNLPYYLGNPLDVFKVWQGGMSFHGGLLGVLVACWLYSRRINRTFFEVTDFLAPIVPVGLFTGRIGNFINAELWGKPADVPWAMVFPGAGALPQAPVTTLRGIPRRPVPVHHPLVVLRPPAAADGRLRAVPAGLRACSVSQWNSCANRMPTWVTSASAG